MKTRDLIVEAYLHMLGYALLGLGLVSLIGFALIEQPTRHNVVLLPDSAILAALAGTLLLAVIRGSWRLQLLAMLAVAFLAVYTLVHNHIAGGDDQGRSLMTGFLRMRSGLALVVLLVTSAICLGLWVKPARRLVQLIGLIVVLLALISQLDGHELLPAVLTLGFKFAASHVANLFTALMGFAAIAITLLPSRTDRQLDRLSLSAGVFGVLITCSVWYMLSVQALNTTSRESDLLLTKSQASATQAVNEYLARIERMVRRWQAFGDLPSLQVWEEESSSYLKDFSALELIAVIDNRLQPEMLETRDDGEVRWLQEFLADPANTLWLEHLFEDDHGHMSQVREYANSGGPNALVAAPLRLPGQPQRLVVASINTHDVVASALGNQLSNFIVRAYEHELLLYDSNQGQKTQFNTLVDERMVPIEGRSDWRLKAYLDRPAGLWQLGYLPALVLMSGLLLTFLLVLSQRLAWMTHERTRRAEQLNDQLQTSSAEKARMQKLNQRIMQFTHDVFCSIDAQGQFVEISSSCERLFGYSAEELIGRRYMDLVLESDHAATELEAAAIMAGQSTRVFRNRYRHKDGRIQHVLWTANWSEDEQVIFAVAHDVTALMQHEAFRDGQRDILGMITTDRALQESLEAICLMVEEQQPWALCSVQLLDQAGVHLINGAAPNLPDAFVSAIEGVAIGPSVGSCGTAAFRRQQVVVEDIAHDPLWNDYRDLALQHGLRSCWSFPLVSQQGQVLGTFALYQHEVGKPTEAQIQQLTNAAQLAALAIARSQDRQSLQRSEQRFRSLFTFNPDPVFSFDLQGKFLSMNGAGVQLTGLSEQQIMGQHFSALVLEEDRACTEQHFASACSGIPQRYETHINDAQGRRLTLDVTNLPIKVDEQIIGVFGIAKDISEREYMTDALQQALSRAERKAEQLRDLSAAAVASSQLLDHKEMLDYLVERVRLVVGAHQAVISLTRGDNWAQAVTGVSLSEKYAAWQSYTASTDGSGIYALICQNNQPLLMTQAELEAHPRWRGFGEHAKHHPPMRGWLAVPLLDKNGRNLGLLQLSDKFEGEFDEGDQAIAQQFAQMAVSVLENSRLINEILAGEQRLQEQLDFTSAITDSMSEGLMAVDINGSVTFFNPAAQALLAPQSDTLDGRQLEELLPLQPELWPSLAAQGQSIHGELCVDKGRLTMVYEARPLHDELDNKGWVLVLRDVSVLRSANKALRERNQFFNLSLEMFCMVGPEGQFIQVNPAFASTLNYSVDALIAQPYIELVHPEDRHQVVTAIEQLQSGVLVKDLQIRVFDAHREQRWLQISASLDEDQLIYCAAQDITEQRAINEQLRQNSLLLSLAGTIAKLGGWSIELPARQVVWSEEMHQMLGFPLGEVPDLEEGLNLFLPDSKVRVEQAVEACIEYGNDFDLDVEMVDAQGKHLFVEVAGKAVYNQSGEIIRVSGALQDISEHKQVLQQVQRMAERLATTLESISDAFFTLDPEWRFTYINPEAEHQLMIQASETLGQTIWDAFPGSYDSAFGLSYRDARRNNEPCHFESFYDPLKSWFEVHAYPSDEGLAVYFQNITERRALDAQLQQTLIELGRSNRELEEFAFVASHDLQEPLRKIQAFSERLLSRANTLDNDGRDYLQRMAAAASRMQTLVIDLLDYSRVTSRSQPPQILEVDRLLDDALQNLETAIENCSAQIQREPLPAVRGDASQLCRVLQNLLSNAMKFHKAGETPQIRIYAEYPDTPGWVLCIADNGIGFEEKYLDRIFNPFQRLHGREAYAGTGIGLAIVKKILERHGATITANSTLGVGSVFRIHFPPMDTLKP